MQRSLYLLLSTILFFPSVFWAQSRAEAPIDTASHAVCYLEVTPSSRATAVVALKQYRDTSRKDEGYVRVELFEQIGRPAHFAIVETWTGQKAFDAHGAAEHTKQLLSKLESIRISGYDQRPYKTLTAGSAPPPPDHRAIYVIAHVDIAGPQTDAPGLLRRLAEASRKDEGSLRFDVLQHSMRANHFTVVEAWQSQKALDAHTAAAHTRQYRDTLQPMSGSPLDERLYKVEIAESPVRRNYR